MSIEAIREEIDRVDTQIIRLIAQRQALAGKIARTKIHSGMPIQDRERTKKVLGDVFYQAAESKIDPVAVQKIFEILIGMSEDRQRECSGDGNLP